MARNLTAILKARFREYVEEAGQSPQNLEFLLENLGFPLKCDYSVESLEQAESAYWECTARGIPDDLSDLEHLAHLIGQYLGESIIHHTGGKWVQSREPNETFGQPCIDDFGGKAWDRVFPVELARSIRELPRKKPNFPGVRDRRVFATALEKAISTGAKKNK
ncbi:MAG TPA: hypothetical protein PLP42_06420 [Acidobacteriota bacterium]|nr:hypothetical protein [Acidobacteriota bacterium]